MNPDNSLQPPNAPDNSTNPANEPVTNPGPAQVIAPVDGTQLPQTTVYPSATNQAPTPPPSPATSGYGGIAQPQQTAQPQPQSQQPYPQQQFPGAGPANGGQAAYNPYPMPGKSRRKLFAVLGALLPSLAGAGVAIYMFVLPMFATIDLETYSGENFSMLVPKEYEKKEDFGSYEFNEKGDDETASSIFVTAEKSPEKISAEERDEAFKFFEESFKDGFEGAAKGNNKLTNYKIETSTFKGSPARIITGDIEKDGTKVGDYKIVIAMSEDSMSVVGVLAHHTDKALSKSTDKIINSFEMK